MQLTFKVQSFEGPLDLLLQLVEREELDISTISLAAVAEQFLQYVRASTDIRLDELADFLLVAAKLIYIKSKLLLPGLYDEDLEQGPDLETQLRLYREFVQASKGIDQMWKAGLRSYGREKPMVRVEEGMFSPPPGVDAHVLMAAMLRVIARLEPLLILPERLVQKVVSVQEKIEDLFGRIRTQAKMVFSEFVGKAATKSEAVASFLALLELVKQRVVLVTQVSLFHDIEINVHGEGAMDMPVADSYV